MREGAATHTQHTLLPHAHTHTHLQVYDTPGTHVTRDYKEGIGKLGDLRFRVVDTSGLEPDRPHQTIQVCGGGGWGTQGWSRTLKITAHDGRDPPSIALPFPPSPLPHWLPHSHSLSCSAAQGRAVEITARVLKNSDLTLLVVDARWVRGYLPVST